MSSDGPATVELRLAPGEPLAYQWQVVNHVQVNGTVEEIDGPSRHADRAHLTVTPDDYGIGFVPVDADASLLAQAVVEVDLRRHARSTPVARSRRSRCGAPERGVRRAGRRRRCANRRVRGGACRRLPPSHARSPARALRIDPFSFEGSGAREVEVQCAFDDDAEAAEVLVELAPEEPIGDAARGQRLRLTRANPTARWSWLALSPFRSGFRWRMAGQDDWSPVLQPTHRWSCPAAVAMGEMPWGY